MGKKLDITNMVFGRLTVIRATELRNSSGAILWECLCACGKVTTARTTCLKNGHKTSCGCYRIEQVKKAMADKVTTHGMTGTETYISWANMKARCSDVDHINYGGRGIVVCEEWKNSFEAFLADMGEKPTLNHQIDRIDNEKGYSRENCRWATRTTNARNKRNSRWWVIDGVRYESSGHAARVLGINTGKVFEICSSGRDGNYSELKYQC